eukprot:754580-Hanusia_phi.AAC.1
MPGLGSGGEPLCDCYHTGAQPLSSRLLSAATSRRQSLTSSRSTCTRKMVSDAGTRRRKERGLVKLAAGSHRSLPEEWQKQGTYACFNKYLSHALLTVAQLIPPACSRNGDLQYVAMSRMVPSKRPCVYNSIENHLQILPSSEFYSVKVVTWCAAGERESPADSAQGKPDQAGHGGNSDELDIEPHRGVWSSPAWQHARGDLCDAVEQG